MTETKTKNAYSAFAAACTEIAPPERGKKGQTGNQKYKYAPLELILPNVKPVIQRHGLALRQSTSVNFEPASGPEIVVDTDVIHCETEEVVNAASLSLPRGKPDPKELGRIVTYLRRYTLLAVLNIAPDDEDQEPGQGKDFDHGIQTPRPVAPVVTGSRESASTVHDRGNPQNEPGSSQGSSQGALPATPGGDSTITGIVEEVKIKTGETNGKPWQRAAVKIDGLWYSTFSKTDATTAEQAKINGEVIRAAYTETPDGYRDLLEISGVL